MKKILSLVLALLMSVSVATVGLAAGTTTTAIADAASAADTYAEAIGVLEQYKIMKGINPDTFDADADSDIQRYQMALFCGRIATGWVYDTQWTNGGVNNSGFDDLEGTPAASFYGAISYAAQKGIIEGYGNKKFGPTDGIRYKDALKMVLSTLEYSGLSYPWGWIETAERVGLTKGITGVGYDDILNRGEVAQIIYNALFITTKKTGDTLAARNFSGDFGYKTIIVTAAKVTSYDDAAKIAYLDPADADKDLSIPKGAIGFRVVNENGTLDGTTYYIAKSALGITTEHDNEALGTAFKALFTIKDDGLVDMIGYKPLFITGETKGGKDHTAVNYGLDSRDADGKYPIEKALSGLTLVSKFSKDNYVNAHSWTGGEIIIYNALGNNPTIKDGTKLYAIDWETGSILKIVDKDPEKADVVRYDGDGKVIATYDIAWYYNSLLGKYFQIKTDKVKGSTALDNEEVKIIGINILDNLEELGDLESKKSISGGLGSPVGSVNKTTAYATLDLYSLGDNGKADYGLYTQYAFGRYNEETINLCGDHKKPAYTITRLDSAAEDAWKSWSGDPYEGAKVVQVVKSGACGDHHSDFGYVTGEAVEPGDYVIYSYNDQTGELNILKNITKTNNDKNFVGTGIIRGYDLNERTVTIGSKTYDFDYDNLLGNGMKLNPDKASARAIYSQLLGNRFMNFVNYVICDGKLVYISGTVGGGAYIVVDSYAGISADGYIVVNGYKSDELKYKQFRIGAYDQWLQGGTSYLGFNYGEELFTKGSVYQITSYDSNAKAYYVNTLLHSELDYVAGNYNSIYATYAAADVAAAGGKRTVIEVNEDGYKRTYDFANAKWGDWKRTTDDDKYIIIMNRDYRTASENFAPIVVYSGKVAAKAGLSWYLDGYKLGDSNVYVQVDPTTFKGFGINGSEYAITYALCVSRGYNTAEFNSYIDADGKELLDAYTATADMINLYNGEPISVKALNKKLEVGKVYVISNGWVKEQASFGAADVDITNAAATLLRDARPGSTYRYDLITFSADYFDAAKLSKKLSAKDYTDDLPGGVTYYKVTWNAAGEITLKSINKDGYKALVEERGADLNSFIISHNFAKDGGSAVAYILVPAAGTAAVAPTTTTGDADIGNYIVVGQDNNGKDVYVEGSLNVSTTKVGDIVTGFAVNAITLKFNGAGVNGTNHYPIADSSKWYWNYEDCDVTDWDIWYTVNGGTKTFVYNRPAGWTYGGHLLVPTAGAETAVVTGDNNYCNKLEIKFNAPVAIDPSTLTYTDGKATVPVEVTFKDFDKDANTITASIVIEKTTKSVGDGIGTPITTITNYAISSLVFADTCTINGTAGVVTAAADLVK